MGREERGAPGGTAAVLSLIDEYEAALTWDFRRYFSVPVSSIGTEVGWHEAFLLMQELAHETGSHLHAAFAGLLDAGSQADRALISLATFVVNAFRDTEKYPKPLTLAHPFRDPDEVPPATDEEIEEARAVLARHSMFGDR